MPQSAAPVDVAKGPDLFGPGGKPFAPARHPIFLRLGVT